MSGLLTYRTLDYCGMFPLLVAVDFAYFAPVETFWQHLVPYLVCLLLIVNGQSIQLVHCLRGFVEPLIDDVGFCRGNRVDVCPQLSKLIYNVYGWIRVLPDVCP